MNERVFRGQWLSVPLAFLCLFGAFLGDAAQVTAAVPVDEGVYVTGADQWQAAGFTGKGVKVGIIQDYLSSDPQFLGNAKITAKSFRADGKVELPPNGNSYGTLYAEAVHQMAPDAEIVFAAIDDDRHDDEVVDWLVNTEHIAVLFNDLVSYVGLPDGTGEEFLQHIKAAGVSIVVPLRFFGSGAIGSASDGGHYGAQFTDTDGDGLHDFSPPSGGQGKNALPMRIVDATTLAGRASPPGAMHDIYIWLSWDNNDVPSTTLTLTLLDENGVQVAQSSDTSTPYQSIIGQYPVGNYTLQVRQEGTKNTKVPVNIFFGGMQAEQIVSAGSLLVPQDSIDVITVGAALWSDDRIAPSASRGPTLDGRPKPDLVGPDCTSSHAEAVLNFGSRDPNATKPSCGTAAAAHMAGAIALYKQAFPDATPDDVLKYFQDHAKKLSGADGDVNTSGAGRLDLGPVPTTAPGTGTS